MGIATEIILQRRIEAQADRYEEMKDAAEFEARVAEKLVDIAYEMYGDGYSYGHDGCYIYEDNEPDKFEILKEARLAVEAETTVSDTDA